MGVKIETGDGVIYKWRDNLYKEKIGQGQSKQEVETSVIKNKLMELYPGSILEHKATGAPVIKNNQFSYISISHSQGVFAFYLSNKPNGVDIQFFRHTLVKGKDYYLNEDEIKKEWTELDLLLIWSAKEAFYKKRKGAIGNFRDEMTVVNIDTHQLWLQYKGMDEILDFQIEPDYVLVWT